MILRGSIFSSTLEMNTGITIIAPEKRVFDAPAKAIYILHGLSGNNGDWTDFTTLPAYAEEYNAFMVMPEVGRSFYADMLHGQKYFTYVSDELPRVCQRLFNVSAKPEDTAVIGASMGGYGALKCALTRPDRFGCCVAFSSACLFLKKRMAETSVLGKDMIADMFGEQLLRDFMGIFGEHFAIGLHDDILELAGRISHKTDKPRIYTACGLRDDLRDDNVRFRYEMQQLNFDITYEEWDGGHDWVFFDQALRRGLHFAAAMG